MYVISKLITNNFGILKGTQELDFLVGDEWRDVIGIRAEYSEDKTRSNRGGKTTITEAIKYAIDGSSRAKKEVQLIHHGEKAMYVALHLLNTEDRTVKKIKRGRDLKNNGILSVDWIEKSRDAQEEINELLKITKEDFTLTNFFKQSDIHGFMDKSSTEKGELLMKWITKDHWKEKEDRVKNDRDFVKGKLNENEATRAALSSSLEITENLELELEEVRGQRDETRQVTDKYASNRNKLFKEYSLLKEKKEEADREINEVRNNLDSAIDDAALLEKNENALRLLEEKLNKLSVEAKPVKEQLYADAIKNKASTSHAYETHKAVLNDLSKINGGICPVLKKSCTLIDLSPAEIEKEKGRLAEYAGLLTQANNRVSELDEQKRSFDEFQKTEESRNSLRKTIALDKSNANVLKFKEELDKLEQRQRVDLSELIRKIKQLDDLIKEKRELLRAADSKIGQLEHRIKVSLDSLSKIDEVSKRSATLRAELEELNYLAFMFGKNGIPSGEIEYAFKDVEDNINYILDNMGCGFNISFSPDKELDKWEPACHCGFVYPKGYRKSECESCGSVRMKQRKNEISFDILENGNESKFELDSGGGRTILSYAVRIAISMLKRDQGKNKLDVLFLDEIDSALDPFFVKQIISSITNVLTKKLGFKQIVMVSHKEKVRATVPHQILVTRKPSGDSEMRFV